MFRRCLQTVLVGVSVIVLASSGMAGDGATTWVVSFRPGPAWTEADDLDGSGTKAGFSMELGTGLAIRDNLVLALEADLLRRGNKTTGAIWLPSATFYPGLGGFYLRAGIGVSNIESIEPVDPETGLPVDEEIDSQTHAEGFGIMTGVGYDWEVVSDLLLGPRLRVGWLNLDDSNSIRFLGVNVGGSIRW